eukprot:PITA_03861
MEVNLTKSKIFFFNTNIAIQNNITKILGFQRDSLPSKYLGIPLTSKPLLKIIREPIINKLQDKIRKWTIRSLNLAGRLVLTKAVLQAIPFFMLSLLPTPKSVLYLIRNIQRNLIWGKGEVNKKWALVAWDKICKPRNYGGLGLDDPEILSKDLGAQFWWCWLKEPKAQWATIWKEKYASTCPSEDHIRMDGNIKGSHTWNKAWDNRCLVQHNGFWEIREGNLALFWEDRWQQEPILLKEELKELNAETDAKGLIKVKDFWDQTNNAGKWRQWRNLGLSNDNPLKDKANVILQELDRRKILVSEGNDQLRKILTWDNIRKRGILGPSRCQLCEMHEETMEHILNNCSFPSKLWESFASIFQQSDRDLGSITNTLNNWRSNFKNNEVLSITWALTPGFIIWNTWKERNNRIFKGGKTAPVPP